MQSFGRHFTILESVDSTNNYAMQQVHARLANHGDAWLALDQTKGKGQRDKQWLSNPGENITMSLVVEPLFLPSSNPFLLIAAVALGVLDFVKHYTGDKTTIKWPNDIYWGDRKAGGILIENVLRDKKWLYAVIGMGVNINQADFGLNAWRAVSLIQITGKKYDVVLLAKQLCLFLENRYEQLKCGNNNQILNDYEEAMYRLNEKVFFKKDGLAFEALIKGVTNDGLLIVETDKEEHLAWGTVEWIPAVQT